MKPSTLLRLFRKLPCDPSVHGLKGRLPALDSSSRGSGPSKRVLVQAVADPYYLLLFSSILREMAKASPITPELFVFRSIEADLGSGFKASIRRSFPHQWLMSRQWVHMYESVAPTIGYRSVSWGHPWEDMTFYFKAKSLWHSLRSMSDLEQLSIAGVRCGDLVIDTYLRFRPAATVDLKDRFLRYLIWQAFRDVHRAQRYFQNKRPEIFLSSYSTYIQHGIAVRVAVACGVRVVTFGNLQELGKVLASQDTFHTKNPVNYRREFTERQDQAVLLQQAREQLELRLSGGKDAATAYMTASAYVASATAFPQVKGAVVAYLHDFFDSPHIYADLVFPDFWTWICFTIETLQEAGIPFYLKRHPNQIDMSAGVVRQLQKKYPQVRFVPEGVTTRQLAVDGMACAVTVYGTVAHEVAYLGVPSIACARHPHVAFDFCHTARTCAEYAALLRRANTLTVQDPGGVQRQVLEFYAMHNLAATPDQLVAKKCMVELWQVCLASDRSAQSMLKAADALAKEIGFMSFVRGMAVS